MTVYYEIYDRYYPAELVNGVFDQEMVRLLDNLHKNSKTDTSFIRKIRTLVGSNIDRALWKRVMDRCRAEFVLSSIKHLPVDSKVNYLWPEEKIKLSR